MAMTSNNAFSKFLLCCLLALGLVCFPGCDDDDDPIDCDDDNIEGYLYTTTNGESTNQVVRFFRHEDGTLSGETAYPTNSRGGANPNSGGDAHGDFDSEGAIQLFEKYLLTVNAGGNTISVFSLDRSNGDLSLMHNTDSKGTRPVSITSTPIRGTDEHWLVVGNQWNNPAVIKDGTELLRLPNDAFHMGDLTQPHPSDAERNIHLFRFNANTGSLIPLGQLDNFVRKNGGPVKVSFSPDGSKLAVSLWGITHFLTPEPSLEEQTPSRVYVYDFDDGVVSNGRFFEEEGISGTIGFVWAPYSNSTLFVSNFNTTVAKTANSLTVLEDNGTSLTKVDNYVTSTSDDLDEACWTVIGPNNDRLYVSSFGANVISPFSLNGSTIAESLPVSIRTGNAPTGDSKDVFVTPNNKYLYNLGAFQSFSIILFDITPGGLNYRKQMELETTRASIGTVGAYNFLGLAGFDKQVKNP